MVVEETAGQQTGKGASSKGCGNQAPTHNPNHTVQTTGKGGSTTGQWCVKLQGKLVCKAGRHSRVVGVV